MSSTKRCAVDRLPTLKERAIASAQELLDAHDKMAVNENVTCPCLNCDRARKLIQAWAK